LDDLFLKNAANVKRAIDIFKDLKLSWRSMAHVQTFRGVPEEDIIALRQSGCTELFIGIESGSPKVLKSINKTSNVEVIKSNVSMLLKHGINVKGYFIYGFPKETVEDFEQTYSLARFFKDVSLENGTSFRTSVFQFRPYHGTELYHSLETEYGDTTFSKVSTIEPNGELSDMVGRIQFNFHSGNYSYEHIDVVQKYIYDTTNLNSVRIFPPYGGNSILSTNQAV
jgi:anaerobic magnesium-protoporphyrin IX monomethyl ester cyclase